ncbi:MAG: succinyl-diaminopimelate desuccinylase [Alphaproteobacteria bacterium]|nr:MAG: succinyl-diaminopimelate desuccinylase [Alphaproteobacteria bacterium]
MLEHELAKKLIKIKSITPENNGCLELIASYLPDFEHSYINKGNTSNLFSKYKNGAKHFAFAGHIDVVPVSDNWSVPPFDGVVKNGYLYGRGTNDMKGAIACFVAAFLEVKDKINYSVSFLLTSDEEGDATYGTREIIKYLQDKNEKIDLCLIGEPTSKNKVGDRIKIGSRGSINTRIRVHGQAGHVGYPDEAKNPIPIALDLAKKLNEHVLDKGNEHFQASNLELTSIDVNNTATNVIPPYIDIRFNIRFNDIHTHESLKAWIQSIAHEHECHFEFCGIPYYCDISKFNLSSANISTHGAASDGFIIKDLCPCFELGLFYDQAHQKDERVLLEDLTKLKEIYKEILLHF